jgi:23S rRNA-/tRNA-specific pseudouridylate synthase
MKPRVIACRTESSLADVLDRLGEGAGEALAQGRIFIGARRATRPDERIPAGAEVTRFQERECPVADLRILAERDGLVAVFKPAEVATIPDHHGRSGTLVEKTATAIGLPVERLFATSRLDVGVSGVVLFATSESARQKVARARVEGVYLRHYVAICIESPVPDAGVWNQPIGRHRDPRMRRVGGPDARLAETSYSVVSVARAATMLAVEPKTGRTHQIRVHAAHAGAPLLGDRAYGGPTRLVSPRGSVFALPRIALHAAWIDLSLGSLGRLHAEAPLPDELRAIWSACDGDPSAWAKAVLNL